MSVDGGTIRQWFRWQSAGPAENNPRVGADGHPAPRPLDSQATAGQARPLREENFRPAHYRHADALP
jgi:hypothetical protein